MGDYPAIHIIITIFTIMSVVVSAISMIGVAMLVENLDPFLRFLLVIIVGVVVWAAIYSYAEFLKILVRIEYNTRKNNLRHSPETNVSERLFHDDRH